jgi:hypothetical protein
MTTNINFLVKHIANILYDIGYKNVHIDSDLRRKIHGADEKGNGIEIEIELFCNLKNIKED